MIVKQYDYDETLKIQTESKDKFPLTPEGYPTFNTNAHTLIDLSEELIDPESKHHAHTLSIKLPHSRYVTLCVMQPAESQNCVDVEYFKDGGTPADEVKDWTTRAMGFSKTQGLKHFNDMGLYTVVCDKREEANECVYGK